jgi:hypothetical protein
MDQGLYLISSLKNVLVYEHHTYDFSMTFEVEKFQICPVQNLTSEWSSEFVMSGHIFHH